jgi:diaminohydroxyphosphoribosylaminopyrimidine deaminase / 5-amino-6-(5-phosphoribosylamino)uracil reductase
MTRHWSQSDRNFMEEAFGLARSQLGRTGTSPAVGCVIVHDGVIVGRGATADGGRPHAEAMALMQAGPLAKGATVYVTLEPCAHVSERGPTCSRSLIDADVARVVASIEDPDPRTRGNGFRALRDANIAVERGLMAPEGHVQIADFAKQFLKGKA